MKKTSIASLQERLASWIKWDLAAYHLGACLGFWPEYGAPKPEDPWHSVKATITNSHLGDTLAYFLFALSEERCLDRRDQYQVDYRWNKNYVGHADLMSVLSQGDKVMTTRK